MTALHESTLTNIRQSAESIFPTLAYDEMACINIDDPEHYLIGTQLSHLLNACKQQFGERFRAALRTGNPNHPLIFFQTPSLPETHDRQAA